MSENREASTGFASAFPGAPILGNITKIRDAVTADDVGYPALATGYDFSGFHKMRLFVKLEGTTPVWTITVLLKNPAEAVYGEILDKQLSGAKTHILDLDIAGCENVNCMVNGKSGTSPQITVWGQGWNQ